VYDLEHPRIYPPGHGTIWLVPNLGNAPAHWTARIFGPCTGPAIVNLTSGQEVSLPSLALTEDQFVEIDSREHTVLADGVRENSRWHTVDFVATTWWQLSPGVSWLRFRTLTYQTPSHVDFRWRHTSLL
jgi:hypothetical protein